jgi:LysR family transcriptional regulator, hydrogen peroxide-inducible genes activator
MELHQLRYFIAIAETASFSRAAERCHVSQPSLSQQIKKLEERLGQRLFDRLGKKVALTEAGKLLLDRVSVIVAHIENAEREIRDSRDVLNKRLSIGALPTIAPYFVPPLVEHMVARYPDIELTIHEDLTKNLIAATASGELDLAIVALPINDPRLQVKPFYTERLLVAMAKGHPLAKRRKLSLNQLAEERFIRLSDMHCLGEQVSSFCHDSKFNPQVACHSAQIETLQSLVAQGFGLSFVPEMARKSRHSERIAYRSLSDFHLERTLAMITNRHRYLSRLATQLQSELTLVIRSMYKG